MRGDRPLAPRKHGFLFTPDVADNEIPRCTFFLLMVLYRFEDLPAHRCVLVVSNPTSWCPTPPLSRGLGSHSYVLVALARVGNYIETLRFYVCLSLLVLRGTAVFEEHSIVASDNVGAPL